jgi:porphobilinogen synthase
MKPGAFKNQRPRINRRNVSIRDMVAETSLNPANFVYPVFIEEGSNRRTSISTLPGQARISVDCLLKDIPGYLDLGVNKVALFPKISDGLKNSSADEALNEKGFLPKALRAIKKEFPELILISDLALDPFSSDGHDGIVQGDEILNDATVEILAQMACIHASCGADYVAPSDMMDGRVGSIRRALEKNGHTNTGIIAYTAKYASSFYGPFREALDSAPRTGDKKTYQMDYRNSRESLRELGLDIAEGADIVMVKPALSYLDIIQRFKQNSKIPIAAYNVSGEYAMVKAAAGAKIAEHDALMSEILFSIRRAGADIIFSYHAIEMSKLLLGKSA